MTKQEFLRRMVVENPLKDSLFTIEVEELIDSPYIFGCYEENGAWKVYETRERGGYFIIKEFSNESDAFDFLYRVVNSEREMLEYIKNHRYRE